MKKIPCIPRFISIWNEYEEGIEINAFMKSMKFEGMAVDTMKKLEETCSGEYSLEEVTEILSKEWGAENSIHLIDYLINEEAYLHQKIPEKTMYEKSFLLDQ